MIITSKQLAEQTLAELKKQLAFHLSIVEILNYEIARHEVETQAIIRNNQSIFLLRVQIHALEANLNFNLKTK